MAFLDSTEKGDSMLTSTLRKLSMIALSVFTSASMACALDNGAFFQTIGTMPQGTFSVAIAINQANENEQIVVSEKHGQRLDMIMWQLYSRLKPHYQGEKFNVSIYEISGNHFIQLTGDGKSVTAVAHELPNSDQQDFIVTDASVLFALANQQMTLTNAVELGMWQNGVDDSELVKLLTKALG